MLSCAGDRMCSEAAQRHCETAPREPQSQRVWARVCASSVCLCLSTGVCLRLFVCVCVHVKERQSEQEEQRD